MRRLARIGGAQQVRDSRIAHAFLLADARLQEKARAGEEAARIEQLARILRMGKAQDDRFHPPCPLVETDKFLAEQLAQAVGRIGAQRVVFRHRQRQRRILRIDLAGTGKDETPDASRRRSVEQHARALDIGAEHRRAVGRDPGHEGAQMQHRVHPGDRLHAGVRIVEAARDFPPSGQFAAAGAQIETRDLMPRFSKCRHRRAPDTPGTSGYKNTHQRSAFSVFASKR